MSDIKKELKVIASLDDSAIRKQIKSLQKELGAGISLQGNDLTQFKKTFDDIAKSFASEIRKAVRDIGIGGRGAGVGGAIGSDRVSRTEKKDKEKLSEMVRRANEEAWKEYSQEQGKAHADRVRQIEKEEKTSKKSVESVKKEEEKLRKREEREKAKEHDRDLKRSKEKFESLKQRNLDQQIQNSRLDRSMTARSLRALGMSDETARSAARGVEGAGGIGGLAKGAAGVAGAAGAAGIGALEIQRMLTERKFREVSDVTSGRHLEALARQQGRGRFMPKFGGALAGGVAGMGAGAMAGSVFGPVGTVVGGAIGGIGGAITGGIKGSNIAGELSVEKIGPMIEAFQRAREISGSRRSALRGGMVAPSTLDRLNFGGANRGFSPEETMQQFMQSREFMGNSASAQTLGGFQRLMNTTGTGVGMQAQAAELFGGATGTGMRSGAAQQEAILKKGVAAGLDVSKSGQFLRETMNFVQSTAGFGKVDLSSASERLARSAAGFAGGGEVSQLNLQQARQLQETMRTESFSRGGISGLGNISGVQEALGGKASTGQFLSAMSLSSNASVQDIMQSLQVDEATAKKIKASKEKGALQSGLDLLAPGDQALQLGLGAMERGISTEQQLGARRGETGGPMLEAQNVEDMFTATQESVESSNEFKLAVEEASLASKQITEGLSQFNIGILEAQKGALELSKALVETGSKLREYADEMRLSNQGE